MDHVVRTEYSEELEQKIESLADERKELSEIRDEFFKPEGSDLENFSPADVIVRRRTFPDRQTVVKINIIDTSLGYTDTKEEVDSLEGFEKWGEFTSFAVEYSLSINGEDVSVLKENFSFGKYFKLEADSEDILRNGIDELNLEMGEIIEKNSALLLAESMDVIH